MKSLAFWILIAALIILPFAVDSQAALAKFRGHVIAEGNAPRIVVRDARWAADCAALKEVAVECDCGPKTVRVKPADECHVVSVHKRASGVVVVNYDRKPKPAAPPAKDVRKTSTSTPVGAAPPTDAAPFPQPPKE